MSLLVPDGHSAESFQRAYVQSGTPATEAAAKRTLQVAQRIYDANTQMPVQPTILTIGRPEQALFHEGYGGLNGSRVFITEGLINACKTEDQLAAVLCVQFGKVMAERAERSGARDEDKGRLTIDERVGRESDRGFGSADGTRMMEIAKRQKMARERKLKADPTQCAETYLRRANFAPQALLEVSALLLQVEKNEEEMREAVSPAPTKSVPASVPDSLAMPPAPPSLPSTAPSLGPPEKKVAPPASLSTPGRN
jgi:predicted Zn-dependent protease